MHVNFLWAVNSFSKKNSVSLNTHFLTSMKKYPKNHNFKKFMVKLPCVLKNMFLLSFKFKKRPLQTTKISKNLNKLSLRTLSECLNLFSHPHHMIAIEINFFTGIFVLFFHKVSINAVIFLTFGWCLTVLIVLLLKSYTKTQVIQEYKNWIWNSKCFNSSFKNIWRSTALIMES